MKEGAVCPAGGGPMGLPPSHLRHDRMYVCRDYKLIVHWGPRRENHIRGKGAGLQGAKIIHSDPFSVHANEKVD